MNIPNIITAVRFVLIPVFGYYLFNRQYYMAAVLFSLGGLSDVLDGYIARKYNMITHWGQIADPMADKLMQITALGLLTREKLIPAVFLIVVLAKDVFMGLGSLTLYKKENVVVSANWYGKLATVVLYFVIVGILLTRKFDFPNRSFYVDVATGVAVVFALFAFFMYVLAYKRIRTVEKD